MAEVGVAFPNDETTAQVIASRLRAAGIHARVDRGLWGTYQALPRNQITVFVDERHARKAHRILGTRPLEAAPSEPLMRLAIIALAIVVAFGVFIAALLAAGFR